MFNLIHSSPFFTLKSLLLDSFLKVGGCRKVKHQDIFFFHRRLSKFTQYQYLIFPFRIHIYEPKIGSVVTSIQVKLKVYGIIQHYSA